MRKVLPVIILLITLIALAARPTSAAPAAAPDCATQNSNLVSSGRPIPEARLVGSSNPALNTPAPLPPPAPNAPAPVLHTVQPGEWLSAIARQYGVTVSAILAANNIANPNVIYRGQVLIIPVPGSAPVTRPAAAVAALPAPFHEAWLVGDAW
jgi:LysM repeat protein